MQRTICFTIDVEPDFGGLLCNELYFGKKDLPKLEKIIKAHNIKLTAFVTGRTLENNPEFLESLIAMKTEIEQHSYSHQIDGRSKIKDIEKGIEIHEKIVGKPPLGYRAPQGIITKEEVLFLESMGIKFDSSIFPTFFPGRFNRLSFPIAPFMLKGSNILELPFAVIPKLRIPISLSYMQMLGLSTFKFFFLLFGLPEILVYDFHTYELGKVASYNKLPQSAKLGYYRAQRIYNDPASVLDGFVRYILSRGYESKYMIDVYGEVKSNALNWEWKKD